MNPIKKTISLETATRQGLLYQLSDPLSLKSKLNKLWIKRTCEQLAVDKIPFALVRLPGGFVAVYRDEPPKVLL